MSDEEKPKPDPTPDLQKMVDAAVAKHGDQTSALKAIIRDLYSARDDLKELRKKLPPEGSRVISGDDLKDFDRYRELGTPTELRKAKEERETLATENAKLNRDGELRTVAENAHVKHAVLKTLAGSLVFGEAKQKDKAGKETTVVTVKDGEAEPVPFDAYAEANWSDFLPALKPGAERKEPATLKMPGSPSRRDDVHRPPPKPEEGEPETVKRQMLNAGLASF